MLFWKTNHIFGTTHAGILELGTKTEASVASCQFWHLKISDLEFLAVSF
jgi:hypothetical protein